MRWGVGFLISLLVLALPMQAYAAVAPVWEDELEVFLMNDAYAYQLSLTIRAEEGQFLRLPVVSTAAWLALIKAMDLAIVKPLQAGINIDARALLQAILERILPDHAKVILSWYFHSQDLANYIRSHGSWVGPDWHMNEETRWRIWELQQIR